MQDTEKLDQLADKIEMIASHQQSLQSLQKENKKLQDENRRLQKIDSDREASLWEIVLGAIVFVYVMGIGFYWLLSSLLALGP